MIALLSFFFPSRTAFYTCVGAFVLGFVASAFIAHEFNALKTTAEVNNARAKERGAISIAFKHETLAINELHYQLERAREHAKSLQTMLKNQPACRLNPDIVRVLNDGTMPDNAAASAVVATTAAPVETVTTNDAIAWAQNNNETVCIPNAQQLANMQAFYNDLRECFNSRRWLDKSCKHLYDSP